MQASDLRSLSLLSYFGSEQDVSSVESVQEYIMKHSTVHSISLDHIELYSMCDDVSQFKEYLKRNCYTFQNAPKLFQVAFCAAQ